MFTLPTEFLAQYARKTPNFGPLGLVTYSRTYSRPKVDGTQEQWFETVQRVVEGCYRIQEEHCHKLGVDWTEAKAQESAQEMYARIFDFKFLPPGRGLWTMGSSAVEKSGAALFNCAFVSTVDLHVDFAEPFCWSMEMLMLGVGVGFDSVGAGTFEVQKPDTVHYVYTVPDTREGWVEALRLALNAYAGGMRWSFDYSLVRPLGAPIKGFGGVASGPGPLKELLDAVPSVLDPLVGQQITVTAINDIMNLIGRCVVSGNVRRSAELSLGPATPEFLNLKNPAVNQARLANHGWAANNSISAEIGMDYTEVAKATGLNGEPGYVWLDNCRDYGRMADGRTGADHRAVGTNPCGEITLESYELCNIVETFPANHDSFEDYQRTLKFAYLYAKTVTLLRTHSKRTNAVIQRNRRIGCSMSGIAQAIAKLGTAEFLSWCDYGYGFLRELDVVYSEWLCVPRSVKMTAVKPSGSVSLLPGATPGIHFAHSEHYIRRIRFQSSSPILKVLAANGYPMEPDAYTPNTTCVSFPVREPYYARGKMDVSMWEQLELAAQIQHYWADNSVSVTVTFKPEEKKDIKFALELYQTRLKSVSFLPIEDHAYVQAPYETISAETYAEMSSKITPVVSLEETAQHEVTEKYCDGGVCAL